MWLQISSGRGPGECELAVMLFAKKYLPGFFKKQKIKMDLLEVIPGSKKNTARSILVSLNGDKETLEKAAAELTGTMKWIQKSPFRREHQRKNWFFNCSVIKEPSRCSFSEKDLTIETTRSSGPGGQNVNKVETAVRVKHVPTGISVFASEERSQNMNRKLALARLEKALEAHDAEKEERRKRDSWMQHNSLERGNAVKVFRGMGFRP